jgi:FkbM family methyltransferase
MISYSQNFEDVVLNRVFHNVKNGFYIDVGAWDPTSDSVTKHFYDKGWNGINIEPVKRFYDKFVEQRPRDINLNCVVSDTIGELLFKEYGDSGLSTYNEQFLPEVVINMGFTKSEYLVRSTTLATIIQSLDVSEIHFLKIDVEGAEKDVLMGMDWVKMRPKVILLEAIRPKLSEEDMYSFVPTWHEWEYILNENGYEFALFDGLNRFYYRSEEPELQQYLSAPANITDGFKLCSSHQLLPTKEKKSWKSILTFRT